MSRLQPAGVLFDDTGIPASVTYDDVYFSRENGLAESEYVFLQQNHLADRFRALTALPAGKPFVIGETGFGSGLNFCNVLKLWQSFDLDHQQLVFVSVEQHPLQPADLKKTLSVFQGIAKQAESLAHCYPKLVPGFHDIQVTEGVRLLLIFDEVVSGFESLADSRFLPQDETRTMDAWFLDGFSPKKNAAMWRPAVFEQLARLSTRETTLATFTAAGFVRRGLQAAGFQTRRIPGFGRKREMLGAQFQGLPRVVPDRKKDGGRKVPEWSIYRRPDTLPEQVLIVGAGVAGVITANTLSRRGFKVTLVDRNDEPLREASGNRQAVIFPKLSSDDGVLARYHLGAFLYGMQFYQRHCPTAFHASPLLQLLMGERQQDKGKKIRSAFSNPQFVEYILSDEASKIAGVCMDYPALYFPDCGWIDPAALPGDCAGDSVNFLSGCAVEALSFDAGQWSIETSKGLLSADAVVLCNAVEAERLLSTIDDGLMIKGGTLRGQVSHLNVDGLPDIQAIICHKGYICPKAPSSEDFSVGGTYDLHTDARELLAESQNKNIDHLVQAVREFSGVRQKTLPLSGKTGFRATSRDYLPLVGPVPDSHSLKKNFASLRHNKNAIIPCVAQYHPHLYMHSALGSKGFTTAPVNAAILAGYLQGGFFPLDFQSISALHPGRFLIREIIKG